MAGGQSRHLHQGDAGGCMICCLHAERNEEKRMLTAEPIARGRTAEDIREEEEPLLAFVEQSLRHVGN